MNRDIDRAKFVAAVPLIGVNAVAMYGQYGYLHDHLPWPTLAVVGLAFTIESIAVYLAYMAHKAMLDLDSSLRLKLGAYLFGLLAGAMNLSHYSPHWHISVAGIATGILSASSPWLWQIYSRRQSRRLMAEKGLIEPGAVRLGNRWLVHPIWCVPVFRYAVWNGIRNPSEAIRLYNESKPEPESEPEPEPEPERETVIVLPERSKIIPEPQPPKAINSVNGYFNKTHAIRSAFDALGSIEIPANDVITWLADNHGIKVTDNHVRQVKKTIKDRANAIGSNERQALTSAGNDTDRINS
jgi:hypothetical protein